MQDVAGEVEPGDTIGRTDEAWVSNGAEGLANVGCVGDIAVGRVHDGADAVCVGGPAEVCFGGFGGPGIVSFFFFRSGFLISFRGDWFFWFCEDLEQKRLKMVGELDLLALIDPLGEGLCPWWVVWVGGSLC